MTETKIITMEYTPEAAAGMFESLAGAPPPDFCGFSLRKAHVHRYKNVVRLDFADDAASVVSVWVSPAGAAGGTASTPELTFTLQPPGGGRGAAARKMTSKLARYLHSATLQGLEKCVLENSGYSMQADYEHLSDLDQFFNVWRDETQGMRFFHYDAVWRYYFVCYSYRQDGSIQIHGPNVFITHGDAECPRNFFFNAPGLDKFLNFPWHIPPERNASGAPCYSTNLDDIDIIEGCRKKLSSLLDGLPSPEGINTAFINTTCLSLIIGDDVEAAVRRFTKKTGARAIMVDALKLSVLGHLGGLLDFGPDAAPGAPERANLVGFAANPGRDEVASLLGGCGITVNSYFLPDVHTLDMRGYRDAGMQIFHPSRAFAEVAQNLLKPLPLKTVEPPAPAGVAGTWRFLEEASRAAGTMDKFGMLRERLSAGIDARLAETRERSSRHTIGLVVQSMQAELFASDTATWGVPLAALLEELGFKLRVMVHSRTGLPGDLDAFKKLVVAPEQHEFALFTTRAELEELLRGPGFDAVYSDIFHDSRLTRAGKNQFGMSHIELGFEGAFRTAERLRAICAAPFHREYAKYLAGARGAADV